jgi:hypothetical protein
LRVGKSPAVLTTPRILLAFIAICLMSRNRITQTRRFHYPEGWQPGLKHTTVVPPDKGVTPIGPAEIQFGLTEWLCQQFRPPVMESRHSPSQVLAHLN